MASQNKLLSPGTLIEDALQQEEVVEESTQKKAFKYPFWIYHETFPNGVLLRNDTEASKYKHLKNVEDHPGKIRLLPGHEHLFKGEK